MADEETRQYEELVATMASELDTAAGLADALSHLEQQDGAVDDRSR